MQTDRHRVDRNAEHGGDLRVAELLPGDETQELPVGLGEPIENGE
jgi:hypothetical protein